MGCGTSKKSVNSSDQLINNTEKNNDIDLDKNNNDDVIKDNVINEEDEEKTDQLIPNQPSTLNEKESEKNEHNESLTTNTTVISTQENLKLSPYNTTKTSIRLSVDNTSSFTSAPRGRTVSILTDDGYDDLNETEQRAEDDVVKIYTAMKSMTTFSGDLIHILVPTHIRYRRILCEKFQHKYNEDLVKSVKRGTVGNLSRFLVHLLLDNSTLIAYLMREYIERKEYVLLAELLTTFKPKDVEKAKNEYLKIFDISFVEDVYASLDESISKSLKDVMIPLCSLHRQENTVEINHNAIEHEADKLSLGAYEIADVVLQKTHSTATLAAIFERYRMKYYLDIGDSIDIEFHDVTKNVITSIVRICEASPKYFVTELQKAFENENEKRILDILVIRQSHIGKIIEMFDEISEKTFLESIKTVVSSTCEDAVILFIKKHCQHIT